MGADGSRIKGHGDSHAFQYLRQADAGSVYREVIVAVQGQVHAVGEVVTSNGEGGSDRSAHSRAHRERARISPNPGIGKSTGGRLDADNHGLAIVEDIGSCLTGRARSGGEVMQRAIAVAVTAPSPVHIVLSAGVATKHVEGVAR